MTQEEVKNILSTVIYPGFQRDIVSFGFVKNIEVFGNNIKLVVEIVSANKELGSNLKDNIILALKNAGAENVDLNLIQPNPPKEQSNSQSGKNLVPNIHNFVMVSSGKGGVGKSTTTVNLAISLAAQGKKVGILDADIYGPNIPRMLGVMGVSPEVVGQKVKPISTLGVEMMSMGCLLEEGQSLIWRGSMIMKAIEQLLVDIKWGELDVLFIDMPPGTGDAQLTLAQSVPVSAGVCVSTPQQVALDDTLRSLDMFDKLHIPIAGIVENMSGFICPDNGKEYDIFGRGTTEKLAKEFDTQILGQIPIEPAVRVGGDEGKPVAFYKPESQTAKRYFQAAQKLWEFIEQANKDGLISNHAIQPVDNHGKSACSSH